MYGESAQDASWFYARKGTIDEVVHLSIVVDVVTESVRKGLMSELLQADDLVLMSEMMEGLREKFWKWKEEFESKGKTKVVVIGAQGEVF